MAIKDINIINPNFEGIVDSLIERLKANPRFKDFNFKASNLRVLIDLLANNTAYNAMYLNMVGNELFLDTALHRNSVISKAKELNYVPRSNVASSASINIKIPNPVEVPVYMKAGTTFISEPVNGVSYSFVSVDDAVSEVIDGMHTINGVTIKQGVVATESWTYDATANPEQIFTIGNKDVDMSTLRVFVRDSATENTSTEYKLANDYLTLDGEDEVFFVQEDFDGYYQFYFGDNIFGKMIEDGNIVTISYIVTSGDSVYGISSFTVGSDIGGNYSAIIETVSESSKGSKRESIESIKFSAPKTYKNQRRAVTDEDYIIILSNNEYGFVFDTISVWSEGNNTIVCCKPNDAFYLTESQKETIINNVLIPSSVMTKQFQIIDPNYTFLSFRSNVVLKKMNRLVTENSIRAIVKSIITDYCSKNLNQFNTTFKSTEMWKLINDSDDSIVSYDFDLLLQKRILPNIDSFYSLTINFDNPLQSSDSNSLEVYPSFQQYDRDGILHDACYIIENNGVLKTGYYIGEEFVTIQDDVGSVNFDTGTVKLNGFIVHKINNDSQMLNITAKSKTRNIVVKQNRLITLDTSDDSSIQTTISYI